MKWLLSGLVLPPTGPLLLACIGYWVSAGERPARTLGRAMLALGLATSWVAATPLFAGAVMAWLERDQVGLGEERLVRELRAPSPPGAIVVLAGGIAHNAREVPDTERAGDATLARLAYGARLARDTGLPLLLSGGRPPRREQAEASVMARTLERSFGLHARWVEDRSRDTADNATESAKLLRTAKVKRVVLVTQAYHMGRAAAAFEAAGIEVLAAPHGFMGGLRIEGIGSFLPSASTVRASWLGCHEALGLLWYRMRGHLGR